MKRTIALLAALALCLGMFAGCGGNAATGSAPAESTVSEASAAPAETPEAPQNEAEASAAEPSPEAEDFTYVPLEYPLDVDDGTSLSLWMTMQLSPNSAYSSFNEHPFVNYVLEQTGVEIDLQVQSMENGADQTQLMLASGEFPDMMVALSYASGLPGAIEEDIIYDLADYDLPANAPDYYQRLVENNLLGEVTTDDGQIPSIAAMRNGSRGPESGIIVHQEMLDALSLDAPVTYDDYEDVLTAFKSEYDLDEPLFMDPSGIIDNDSFAVGYGVKLYVNDAGSQGGLYLQDGEVKFGYVEDGFTDYITTMHRWYENGLISSDYFSYTSNEASENIIGHNIAGQVGMFVKFDGLIDLVATLAGDGVTLKALADPVQNAGDQIHLGNAVTLANSNQGIVITTGCDEPELALNVLNWFYTEDGFMYMNYGIEDETYVMGSDGTPQWTEFITNNPDGVDATTMISDYTGGGVLTINDDALQVNSNYSPNAQEAAEIWASNKDGQWELPSALTLTAEEKETYSRIMSDVITSCQEYTNKFINGDAPLSDIPAFQEQLWSMGLQDVLDVYTAAVERYNER